jgi:hypothetical protein
LPAVRQRVSFAVPVGAGAYAPERISINRPSSQVAAESLGIKSIEALIEAVVAASVLELWLLKVGGDPTADADHFFSGLTLTGAAAGQALWSLSNWAGAQLRAKSGGTAGSLVVNASADVNVPA